MWKKIFSPTYSIQTKSTLVDLVRKLHQKRKDLSQKPPTGGNWYHFSVEGKRRTMDVPLR